MLWKKLSSGLEGIVPPPSIDPLVVTPENSVVTGEEFSFSWTSNNSIGVTWEVNEIVGNVIGNVIYSGSGNSNGSTGNLIAPVTDSGLISLSAFAEGNPGADPLFVGQQTLYNVIPAAGDPYYANVVLLLHGDGANGGTTFVDNSQYNRTPTLVQRVTTSNEQTRFGQNTIKSLGGINTTWAALNYATTTDFAASDNYTLEFWIYPFVPLDEFSFSHLFGKDNNSYFNFGQFSLTPELIDANWGQSASYIPYPIPAQEWTYIALSVVEQPESPGFPIYRFYINGVRQNELFVTTSFAGETRALGIVSVQDQSGFEAFTGYLSEIRYTQGVGRYTAATIPIQDAPWPNN
jgi:hypothetical protein